MRPRRIRRVNGPVPAVPANNAGEGFNEAPANSPGNAGRAELSSAVVLHRRCFNEAPANSPGNESKGA